jgi:hypothetical protein
MLNWTIRSIISKSPDLSRTETLGVSPSNRLQAVKPKERQITACITGLSPYKIVIMALYFQRLLLLCPAVWLTGARVRTFEMMLRTVIGQLIGACTGADPAEGQ